MISPFFFVFRQRKKNYIFHSVLACLVFGPCKCVCVFKVAWQLKILEQFQLFFVVVLFCHSHCSIHLFPLVALCRTTGFLECYAVFSKHTLENMRRLFDHFWLKRIFTCSQMKLFNSIQLDSTNDVGSDIFSLLRMWISEVEKGPIVNVVQTSIIEVINLYHKIMK